MSITQNGIEGYCLTVEEFKLLKYLDSRMYLESSEKRFTGWHSSFDYEHPDWQARVEVQSKLANCLKECLLSQLDVYQALDRIRVIYLGASLGSISTYFTLSVLKELGLIEKTDIYIYDLLMEPLERTKNGNFDFSEKAAIDCGFADKFTVSEYKQYLSNSTIFSGSITDIPEELSLFDITIAPYVQHHLNLFDKQLACQQMERITGSNRLIILGDLTFDFDTFNHWLSRHSYESVPYAIESFVSVEQHIGFFVNAELVKKLKGDFYYAFGLKTI